MEKLPENHHSNKCAPCSSMSQDNGGHDQEDLEMQPADVCSCCAKCRRTYRNHIFTSCCVCVVIVAMCCIITGLNNHACVLTKDSLNSRFLNIEQKINRLQKKYIIAKVSKVMADPSSINNQQDVGYEDSYGGKISDNNVIPSEVNIVKRSSNRCQNKKSERLRKKCVERQERKHNQKRNNTGRALEKFVKKTIQKELQKTVEPAIAKAMEKGNEMSFMHFMADDNEEEPNEDFAGRFHKWQYADWAYEKKNLKSKFDLIHSNGDVIVREGGIYMIYAQVTMLGKPDQGFHVVVHRGNQQYDILSKCMMDFELESQDTHEDGNITCSSVGVFRLEKGDTVFLRHSRNNNVKANFHANASFFGFVKLGEL